MKINQIKLPIGLAESIGKYCDTFNLDFTDHLISGEMVYSLTKLTY